MLHIFSIETDQTNYCDIINKQSRTNIQQDQEWKNVWVFNDLHGRRAVRVLFILNVNKWHEIRFKELEKKTTVLQNTSSFESDTRKFL